PTDIWICGYHKSGNTWLSEIVSLIMADGVVARVREQPISERVPNIFYNRKVVVHDYNNSLRWFDGLPEPHIDFEDTCRLFIDGNLLNGDWLQHVTDYWLTYGSNHANVLFVAYEELCADLPAMVRTIARFLGKDFTDETVDTIVNHCTFELMKDNPMANRSEQMEIIGNSGAKFVRNGKVGDWMRHMTDRQSALFDERYGQHLRAIGLRVCDTIEEAQHSMSTDGWIVQKEVTVRPTDIWLCGYPKSGNTWLSEIVSLIMADGVIDRVTNRPISERVPNIIYSPNSSRNGCWFEGLIDPRITLNHLDLKYLPRFDGKEGKMIYIIRNPKDVCVSYYHINHMVKHTAIDWDDWCHLFLNGQLMFGDWLSHVTDFWLAYGTGNHCLNVLFVAYEELIADLPAMIATIARFLGKQFTAETVANITTHCSLQTMRDNPMANHSDIMNTLDKPFVRLGIIGDWRRHMTDTQSALFDERYGQQLQNIGLRVCDQLADAQTCMLSYRRIIS
ncbi:unnamed protein product, partial [Medioppia subpectinata]